MRTKYYLILHIHSLCPGSNIVRCQTVLTFLVRDFKMKFANFRSGKIYEVHSSERKCHSLVKRAIRSTFLVDHIDLLY